MLKIYSDRIRFYLGLILVLVAAVITPTQFLWAVFAYSIAFYLPVSLTLLLMSCFIESFRDPGRYQEILGIRAEIFCWVLGVLGVLLVANYLYSQDFSVSRVGMLMCFAALEVVLLRREAAIRSALERARESAHTKN